MFRRELAPLVAPAAEAVRRRSNSEGETDIMSARKLSDADKQAILEEYRQLGETTLTIANRYGVSNSTISRMLKSSFSPQEYEALIQQKRSTRVQTHWLETVSEPQPESVSICEPSPEPESESNLESPFSSSDVSRRIRRRSSASQTTEIEESIQLDLHFTDTETSTLLEIEVVRSEEGNDPEVEDLEDDDLEDDDFDEDEDLDDFDEDEEDDLDESDADFSLPKRGTRILGQLRVLPFDRASLPKTCYIVVDRMAELITRPLKDFGDLGQIPPEEIQEKTLPVFDNHRVARRFANRSQRVTKVPDGKMLQRVKDYLQAKGITRILVDGQVYSL
jgi:transposase-like protein